jgi:hypothetical protein
LILSVKAMVISQLVHVLASRSGRPSGVTGSEQVTRNGNRLVQPSHGARPGRYGLQVKETAPL